MLRLRFYTPGENAAGCVEPAPFFRLIGSMLCRGPQNEPVATHDGGWLHSAGEFARAESMDPVVIYFEDNAGRASTAYGPFTEFHVVDATAYSGNRMLARLDEKSLLWYPPKALDGWASLLIAPPEKSRFDLTNERTAAAAADAGSEKRGSSKP
jgi:hypothetical protein